MTRDARITGGNSRRGWRAAAGIGVLLILLSCGPTMVTMRVDIFSFLSGDESMLDYGTDPTIPGNGPEITIRSPVEVIPMPEEVNGITDISALEIAAVVAFRNETGQATVIYRAYFHSSDQGIFETPPVIDESQVLETGTDLVREIVIEGDDRLLNLFEGEEISVAFETEILPGGGSEDIKGSVELSDLVAEVTAVDE